VYEWGSAAHRNYLLWVENLADAGIDIDIQLDCFITMDRDSFGERSGKPNPVVRDINYIGPCRERNPVSPIRVEVKTGYKRFSIGFENIQRPGCKNLWVWGRSRLAGSFNWLERTD
jgi:hypothetical protein